MTMNPELIKEEFDNIALSLHSIQKQIEKLKGRVKYPMDQKAIAEMLTDLSWAQENCSVIGLHQIGKLLDDNIGTGK